MRSYLDGLQLQLRVQVFLSLHAYGQRLMFPWGYAPRPADTHSTLSRIASRAVAALQRRFGTSYRSGSMAHTGRELLDCPCPITRHFLAARH